MGLWAKKCSMVSSNGWAHATAQAVGPVMFNFVSIILPDLDNQERFFFI